MTLGVCFYSFNIGSFTSIIQAKRETKAAVDVKVQSLNDFAKKSHLDPEITKKMRLFIENNKQ